MKKILIALLFAGLTVAIIYAFGAFVSASWNIPDWHFAWRLCIGTFALIGGGFAFIFTLATSQEYPIN